MTLLVDSMGKPMQTRKCRGCGCTTGNACKEGCAWIASDLCSRCASPELLAAWRNAQLAEVDAAMGLRKLHFDVDATRIGEPGSDNAHRVIAFEDGDGNRLVGLEDVTCDGGRIVGLDAVFAREDQIDAVIEALTRARDALRAARGASST